VPDNKGASYIKESHIGWTASRVQQAAKVSVMPFDALDIDYSGAGNIILKLDVEGHELRVLQGMSRLLTDSRLMTVIIEYNPETSFIESLLAVTTLLYDAGFDDVELIFKAHADGWSGEELADNVEFDKISPQVIEQLLACGLIVELGFNRRNRKQGVRF